MASEPGERAMVNRPLGQMSQGTPVKRMPTRPISLILARTATSRGRTLGLADVRTAHSFRTCASVGHPIAPLALWTRHRLPAAGVGLLVRLDLDVGQPGVIVDGSVDVVLSGLGLLSRVGLP